MKVRAVLVMIFFTITLASSGQSYKKIHRAAILVDTHNDVPSATIEKKLPFDTDLRGSTHSDLSRMKSGGVDIQVFSVFCDGEKPAPYRWAHREMDSVHEWVNRNPDKMMMVYTAADLEKAVRQNKLGAMLGVEGGHMIEDDISKLDTLYRRGARYMTLTWNNSTSWATSALTETTRKDSLRQTGLTEFGKKVVQRMNELGMIIDVSHVGEQTFRDALAITTKPVIASHSCVYNLCPHRRNLKDEQIKAIAKNGGVIHLNFYAGFIDSTYEKKSAAFYVLHKNEIDSLTRGGIQANYAVFMVADKYPGEVNAIRPPLSLLIDHLDYIVRLAGIDHVGLGSDFDGIEAPPRELNGVQDFPQITRALRERGYSKKDIRKILGGNFIRVFKANQ